MNIQQTIFTTLLPLVCLCQISATDVYKADRARWLKIAKATTPQLHYQKVSPREVVRSVEDSKAFQGWRFEHDGTPEELLYNKSFKQVKTITLDFGQHLTGYLTFHTKTLSRCQDAPIRLRFFMTELPAEMNTMLDPWKGTLSRAWMQDETVTVTQVDETLRIPRRLSGRYLRIDLLGASTDFDFAIDSVNFTASSSAGEVRTALSPACPDDISDINRISIETLRECMQTVYEDGPKRDHRLWAGDMYLQSLANRYSFRNFQMTKHCLYLFAGLSADNGIIISNSFEYPEPHPQYGSCCLPYCLLWNSTLLEYLKDTGDKATALDLWQVARRQTEEAISYVEPDGIFNQNKFGDYVWLFFDWRDGLDVNTPMQGATIFALQQTYELAKMIGKEKEVRHYPALIRKMQKTALQHLYDKKRGVMVSGTNHQISVLSQTWAIKSGILSKELGTRSLHNVLNSTSSVKPGTPYGTHYLIDAMLLCGMNKEARTYLIDYWGGMVRKGADTFWEAYDPENDYISPYNFFPVNSACHAWSCTPVYFINKYPSIFQK